MDILGYFKFVMGAICLLAGSGRLPQNFIEEARRKGIEVFSVGVKGITDFKTDASIPIGKVGKFIKLLHKEGIKDIVMLGKFEHKYIYTELFRLDLKAISIYRRAKDKKPATLVKVFMEFLQSEGFNFIDPKPILENILSQKGSMNSVEPSPPALEDGKFGFRIAKEIAEMDIGQTVAVKDKAVIAVEAMEGTQETIKRASRLSGKGFRVIKVARKSQDFRIDVPTVGPDTLRVLREAGADSLFLEAGKVFIIDKPLFLEEAERSRICVYGL
jgi:DUF1009 family protein